MDFAKKQLEKFGWKEGTGLGKNEQGIISAIKPTLKVGKEGMGYDFSKELTDTWWTRAYDDSLKRINIEEGGGDTVGVTLEEDDDCDEKGTLVKEASAGPERPFQKMRKRMMKATFPTFSKGATLSNGELIAEEKSCSDESDEDNEQKSKELKNLTDEELLKACGGRTAHKAARFGLKLNGKLARIAAQEELAKSLMAKYVGLQASIDEHEDRSITVEKESKKKKKKSKKEKAEKEAASHQLDCVKDEGEIALSSNVPENPKSDVVEPENEKKKKKSKKRKYEALEVEEAVDSSASDHSGKNGTSEEAVISTEDGSSIRKHKKKNKKHKKSKNYDEESCALLS